MLDSLRFEPLVEKLSIQQYVAFLVEYQCKVVDLQGFYCEVGDREVSHVTFYNRNIRELYLYSSSITNRGVQRIATRCFMLNRLDIGRGTGITEFPDTLPKSLEVLTLLSLRVPALPQSSLRFLRSLKLSNCQGLSQLPELPETLEALILIECNRLKALPELLPLSLRRLTVINCEQLKEYLCPGISRGWIDLLTPKAKIFIQYFGTRH